MSSNDEMICEVTQGQYGVQRMNIQTGPVNEYLNISHG